MLSQHFLLTTIVIVVLQRFVNKLWLMVSLAFSSLSAVHRPEIFQKLERSSPIKQTFCKPSWVVRLVKSFLISADHVPFLCRYGDKAPKSLFARLFATVWMIAGIILLSMFTAQVSSRLTTQELKSDDHLFGKKVTRLFFLVRAFLGILSKETTFFLRALLLVRLNRF